MPSRSHRPPLRHTLGTGPVVVVGATGGVGRGVVEALLEAGGPVIGVARDRARLSALHQQLGAPAGLGIVPGSIADDAGGEALAAILRQWRQPLAGVVVSIAGPRLRQRLVEQPSADLLATIAAHALPHLVAARHLVPLLAQGGRAAPFLSIGSPCADTPWAGYGAVSVSAAATRMLLQVLQHELADQPVRVQQLAVGSPVRTLGNQSCACPEWPSAIEVGRRVVEVLADAGNREAVLRLEPRGVHPAGAPADVHAGSAVAATDRAR